MRKVLKSFCYAIKMDKENDILVVDPYFVSVEDLRLAGVKNIVRVRRPLWGREISITIYKQSTFGRIWKTIKEKRNSISVQKGGD